MTMAGDSGKVMFLSSRIVSPVTAQLSERFDLSENRVTRSSRIAADRLRRQRPCVKKLDASGETGSFPETENLCQRNCKREWIFWVCSACSASNIYQNAEVGSGRIKQTSHPNRSEFAFPAIASRNAFGVIVLILLKCRMNMVTEPNPQTAAISPIVREVSASSSAAFSTR